MKHLIVTNEIHQGKEKFFVWYNDEVVHRSLSIEKAENTVRVLKEYEQKEKEEPKAS
jgi:hypothetical protein